MESRAKILGHPAHQMLVVFPLGMLAWSVVCDGAAIATGDRGWARGARRALGGGLLAALVAAPFGLVDYLAIPRGTRAKRVGALHGLGNVAVLGLFGASFALRQREARRAARTGAEEEASALPIALSGAGFALSGATAWLGGELVDRLGVGVDTPTSLDRASSLEESPVGRVVERAAERVATRVAGAIPAPAAL